MKVLIADDDRLIRAMLRDHLAVLGHAVVEAENGEDAVARAARETPDVLVLDFLMPRLSGIDALREIRRTGGTAPAVLLTAISEASLRVVEGADLAAAVLEKPFTRRSVEHAIARAARTR